MKFRKDKLAARQAAIKKAEDSNASKMKKVREVDRYWGRLWEKPKVELNEEQREEVRAFWDKYSFAYKNDPMFQEIYSYMSGRFDPRYCPNGLNAFYMYRFYDDPEYHTAFHDKNYRDLIFRGFSCTTALVRRIRGYYYDGDYNRLSYDEAISRLFELVATTEEKLIVKPTPGGGGNGITFIRRGDSKTKISNQLDKIQKDDIIIERFAKAHPSYAAANPTSLNSLRIVTLLYEGEVEIIAILFRMGAIAKEVDNFTQGGVACGVTEDGICYDYGIDHFGNRYEKHPNGFEFAGHQLYGVKAAVEMVKKLHWRIPQFKQMSWDVAVVEDGTPTLIEMNPRGDATIYQAVGALPFGEKTERILDDYLVTMFYNLGADENWNYKEYRDHIVLTKYAWDEETISVPETIKGKTVTHIEANCFTGKGIKEIIIPGCVKSAPKNICADGIEPVIAQLDDARGIVIPAPNIVAGENAEGRNIIRWEPVERATSYLVYRMQQGGERKFVKSVSASVTELKDFNVLSDTVYYYWVRAYDSSCAIFSGWSKERAVQTN